jgi:hypothetical protein
MLILKQVRVLLHHGQFQTKVRVKCCSMPSFRQVRVLQQHVQFQPGEGSSAACRMPSFKQVRVHLQHAQFQTGDGSAAACLNLKKQLQRHATLIFHFFAHVS